MHHAQHRLDRSKSNPITRSLDLSLAAWTPTMTTLQAIPFDSRVLLYRQHRNGNISSHYPLRLTMVTKQKKKLHPIR